MKISNTILAAFKVQRRTLLALPAIVWVCLAITYAPVLYGQGTEGFWKLLEIEEEINDGTPRSSSIRHYTTGGPGSVTCNSETDWGDKELVWRVTGSWSAPPGVLIPGEEVEISLSINVSDYSPPDHHWNQSGNIAISDSRPSMNHERRPFRGNYGSLRVEALGEHSRSDKAVIPPPGGGEDYFYTINVSVGGGGVSRRYQYVYEWVPGEPSDEELASAEVSDTLPPFDMEGQPSIVLSRLSYYRGEVFARIDGVWQKITLGMEIPDGSQVSTGSDGIAEVTLADGSFVRMRPGTTLDIPSPRPDEKSRIQMILGRIWIRARRGANFNVETSSAIAGVRGTEFGVEVDPSGREVFICYSGKIEVTPVAGKGIQVPRNPVILNGGEKVSVCPVNGWSQKARLDATEESVGAIIGRPDFSDNIILPRERAGRLFIDRESGDWRLQIYEQGPGARHGILKFEGIAVREAARDRLVSPFGVLLYHGPFAEGEDSGWLVDAETPHEEIAAEPAITGEDLGYSIITPPPGNSEVRIKRNGDLAWSLASWMVFSESEMTDQTGNGIPNLLVRYARGRSFRGFVFLELGPEGVREIWSREVHASEAYDVESEIQNRRESGQSLEKDPGKTVD